VHLLAREVLVLWLQTVTKCVWSRSCDVLIFWQKCVNISKTVRYREKQRNRDILSTCNGRLLGNHIWPIKWQQRQWPWMTLKVIRRLQAFPNAIRRTLVQNFTRLHITMWSRFLCVSWISCMNRETTDKIIVYARNTESG